MMTAPYKYIIIAFLEQEEWYQICPFCLGGCVSNTWYAVALDIACSRFKSIVSVAVVAEPLGFLRPTGLAAGRRRTLLPLT